MLIANLAIVPVKHALEDRIPSASRVLLLPIWKTLHVKIAVGPFLAVTTAMRPQSA
jgi:hypothetical protein